MIKIKSNTEILSALTEYQKVKHYGLKSGIENLDHVMRLDRQRFCIITSNENQGKTTFLNYYSRMMAKTHQMKTLFLSFENSEMKFYDSLKKVYGGNSFVEFSRYLPHEFSSLDDVFKALTEYKEQWGYDMLIIDPFESFQDLMNGNYRSEDYGRILERIRQYTQEHNIITILAAHQRKLSEGEEPTISNIFGSVSFGNKADFIFSVQNIGNFMTKLTTLKIRHNYEEGIKGKSVYFSFDPRNGVYTPAEYDEQDGSFAEVALTAKTVKDATEKAILKPMGEEKRDIVEQLPTERKTSQPAQENKPVEIVRGDYLCSVIEGGKSKGLTSLNNCLTGVPQSKKKEIEKVRGYEYKSPLYDKAKGYIPTFTPSCTIAPSMTAQRENIMRVNNIICMDIDGADNEGMSTKEMKEKLSKLPFVWIVKNSLSNRGVFSLVKIGINGTTMEELKSEFKAYYKAISEELKKVGIKVDEQCNNINRTRYLSLDDNPYFNADAEVYKIEIIKSPSPSCSTAANDGKNIELSNRDKERFLKAMERITKDHLQITHTHEESRSIGRSLANVFGEDGRKYYHIVRAQKPNYDKVRSDERYNEYLADGMSENYTIATFFKFYNEAKTA